MMDIQARFELVVVTSMDGFIARFSGENVSLWTSPEEQTRFRGCFEQVDWGIMGRVTHQQIFKRDRRRIVFSKSATSPEWRDDNHLWVDPNRTPLEHMLQLATRRHPANNNLILGGTAVHDWFLAQNRIDRIQLAIEPISFGSGVRLFSDPGSKAPLSFLQDRGFQLVGSDRLNDRGTMWHTLDYGGEPGRS